MIEETDSLAQSPGPRWISVPFVLTVALAGCLLFLAVRGVDWEAAGTTLRQGKVEYLGLGFLLLTLSYFMRSLRWRVLLNAQKTIPPLTVFWGTCIGYLGNSFLPARAGEFIRSALIGQKAGISKSYVLATALTERLVDAGVLVVVSLVLLSGLDDMPDWLLAATRTMSVIGFAGILGLFIAPYFETIVVTLLRKCPLNDRLMTRVIGFVERFLYGMSALQNTKRMFSFAGLTILLWTVDMLAAIQVARAFELSLRPTPALLLLAALGLSSAVPSTPGYVGIYQFVAVTVLAPFGFSQDEALVFIIAFQLVIYAIVLVWGLLGLWQLSGLELLRRSKQP